MNLRPVLFLVVLVCGSFTFHLADSHVGSSRFERRYDISGLVLNVHGGKTRSSIECGALCDRSSWCQAFCYSQSTFLCCLSLPSEPVSVSHNCDGFVDAKCYDAIGCPVNAGYAMFGVRCVRVYKEEKAYTEARAVCTSDGAHLYHFKTLEGDLPAIREMRAEEGDLDGVDLWVGADSLEVQSRFLWSDASELANSAPVWNPNQPDHANADCVVLMVSTDRLDNRLCWRRYKFVCQADV